MKNMIFLIFITITISLPAFASNEADDTFTVKSVKGLQAVVEGKVKNLKTGDWLYFIKSPYRFRIDSITGDKMTVNLNKETDLTVGNSLIRNPTNIILKSIDTETRLKKAMED